MHARQKKISWPVLWRNEVPSPHLQFLFSPCCLGVVQRAPRRLVALTLEPLTPNALESLVFIVGVLPSCPHGPCPFSLASGIVIGVADSCLPGCLKLPSCAPHRCPTSQHYCSCWAFFLKSFPAVSWYGKPLKLAPDCSVYFVLDKRQNTVPAACQEEGGGGGMGSRGHRQSLLQKTSSQTTPGKGTNTIQSLVLPFTCDHDGLAKQ